jgi:hypothetical protein
VLKDDLPHKLNRECGGRGAEKNKEKQITKKEKK